MDRSPARCLAGEIKPLYNYLDDLPSLEGAPDPMLPAEHDSRDDRKIHQLRRGTRLPVPMLVLHDYQCAGAEVAAAFGG